MVRIEIEGLHFELLVSSKEILKRIDDFYAELNAKKIIGLCV